jgi:hypothetical protein
MNFCDKFWDSSTFWLSTTRITSKLSRPNINLLVHLATVESERAESPQCVLKVGMNFLYFHTFLYEVLNHCSNLSFFHCHKSVSGNNNKESSLPLSFSKSIDTPRVHSQRLCDYCAGTSLC